MRRFLALLGAFVLVSSPMTSSVTAAPALSQARTNSFVGNFDIVDQGVVVGRVVADFKEPTVTQLVPGHLDIYWAPGTMTDPYWPTGLPFRARESHGQILRAWFWDDTYPEVGHTRLGRVQGYLCDYVAAQNADCHGFQMAFADIDDTGIPDQVGFGTFDTCCDGQWHDVGRGSFVLTYVGPTPEPAFLERWGTELALDGRPFHEISFNAYNLLEMSLDGRASDARDELATLGKLGFRVVRVMASPYDAAGFERVFFDVDPDVQAAKRAAYFATFDALLDDADANGIRIVASLMWNVANIGDLGGHSVGEGITNPTSLGRLRVEDYIREVVTRYADRPTIAMWELGNEWNLGADIQWPQFDYTSDDLAAYYEQTASLVRSIDGRHLITTGDSSPRPAAMHLLRAVRDGQPVDWTPDSTAELREYFALINPDPIDVVSIHYYDDAMTSIGGTLGSPANLAFFKGLADGMGKPLFVGEIGCTAVVGCLDGGTAPLPMLRETLPVLVALDLPIVLYWNYAPTVPIDAVRLIVQADRQVR